MINKQAYINAINQDIEMVRGDTLAFNFQLSGLGSRAEYEALTVTFAVAEKYDGMVLFNCTNGAGIELEDYTGDVATFSVCVAPNLTRPLDVARYFYDLQIKDDYNVATLMRGRLTLVYDVAE